MQDRYAGDVGDFSKFALCRALHRELGGPLGVIWYLYPHAEANNDGKHRDYFGHPKWRDCNEDLQRVLHQIAHGPDRSVRQLELAGVLPDDTKYFSEPIYKDHCSSPRSRWFERAVQAVKDSKIVFVDPDNGIASLKHRTSVKEGGKHITREEISLLCVSHPCVVKYRHADRNGTHIEQIGRHIEVLHSLTASKEVRAMQYLKSSARTYFIVSDPALSDGIRSACDSLTLGNWSKHFTCH